MAFLHWPRCRANLLRNQLGYNGIVITDALDMSAITDSYSSAEAAVKAIEAGADMLLMPENFEEAYQGLLEAVQNGTISEDRINESLKRIYRVKYRDRIDQEQNVLAMEKTKVSLKEVLKHWKLSIYTSTIGMLVGALPGAGGPVASFIAYNEAKRIVKEPEVPFGEGAVEGIMASESSNNACIGGALIPMLTLAVPGDAVTAIILSVFYVHGLQPGPMFIRKNPEAFQAILIAGIIACFALLVLGLLVAPRISKVITIPKNVMIPVVTSLCVIGSFACNNRLFDVALMFLFGVIGFLMRRFDYPVAPLILAMVLGQMMDSNFRQAVSLASSADHPILFTFGHWQTVLLLLCIAWVLLGNIPWTKPYVEKVRGVFRRK